MEMDEAVLRYRRMWKAEWKINANNLISVY